MFACMRIACGGEDIEKKYRRENERWCITPIRGYIQSRFKECVCLSPLELPHNMLVKNCSLNIICIENSAQRSAGPIM
jgi:hypothetical protein